MAFHLHYAKGRAVSHFDELMKTAAKQYGYARLQPVRNIIAEAAEANLASEFHARLMEMVERFIASLDEEHEVGVRLVSFGQTVVFHLHSIGYYNPSLITFYGFDDDDNQVQLIQHVSQISILLQKLPRIDPDRQLFGFPIPAPPEAGD